MFTVPVIRRQGRSECAKCYTQKAGVYVESSWRREGESFSVRQFYCWSHFRALLEGIEAVNEFAASAEYSVQEQVEEAKAKRAECLERAKVAAKVAVSACGLDEYPTEKARLIKLLRERYGLGMVEAKMAIEEAYDQMKASMTTPTNGHVAAAS
jgi:ribosomal protein L7/L12